MIPFSVDQSWYETYWYGHALPHVRWHSAGNRRPARAGKIAAAVAVLAAIGGGVALAQGAPPGSAPWQSGWPNYIESKRAHMTSAGKATTTHPDGSAAMARNGEPASVTGNAGDG